MTLVISQVTTDAPVSFWSEKVYSKGFEVIYEAEDVTSCGAGGFNKEKVKAVLEYIAKADEEITVNHLKKMEKEKGSNTKFVCFQEAYTKAETRVLSASSFRAS